MNITIITVCFNSSKTIEETINSVIKQNYFKNVEYIIIDGGSSDDTLNIISKYKDKIYKIVSEKDNGIYDAMNKGIRLATSDIIGILNSDDIFENEFVLSEVANCFIKDPKLDILYGDLVYVKNNDLSNIVRYWKTSRYYNTFFEDGNVPPHPTLFVKSSVYKIKGLFDLKYKLASDYEFMLRIFKSNLFNSKYLNTLFIRMRLGGATNNNFKNIIIGNFEIYKAWNNNNINIPIRFFPLKLYNKFKQFL